jgi:hypothetical protein
VWRGGSVPLRREVNVPRRFEIVSLVCTRVRVLVLVVAIVSGLLARLVVFVVLGVRVRVGVKIAIGSSIGLGVEFCPPFLHAVVVVAFVLAELAHLVPLPPARAPAHGPAGREGRQDRVELAFEFELVVVFQMLILASAVSCCLPKVLVLTEWVALTGGLDGGS